MSTSDSFDHYYVWLGIPPDEQPPTHYRLLGIRFFESNKTVISNAADRQMAHVKSFQNGSHFEESQRLLNELAAARECLLNPLKKCEYDYSIRRLSFPPEPPPIVHSPKEVLPVQQDPAHEGAVPTQQESNREAVWEPPPLEVKQLRVQRGSRPTSTFFWALATLALVLAALGIMVSKSRDAGVLPVRSVVFIQADFGVAGSNIGSSVVVAEGLVLTNYHVVAGASKVTVRSNLSGDFLALGYLASDPEHDLLLLTTRPLETPAIRLASSMPKEVTEVVALGFPRGLGSQAAAVPAFGYLNQIHRGRDVRGLMGKTTAGEDLYDRLGYGEDAVWIQHQVPLAPGNSGGPLVDRSGKLIGINTWTSTGPASQNLNFAIGLPHIAELLKESKRLLDEGREVTSTSFKNLPNPWRDGLILASSVKQGGNFAASGTPEDQAVPPAHAPLDVPADSPREKPAPSEAPPPRDPPVEPTVFEPFSSGREYSPSMFVVDVNSLDPKDKNVIVLKHDNGKVFALASHAKGKLHGLSVGRHNNGEPMAYAGYFEEKRHGLLEAWDHDGSPLLFGQYRLGKRIGIMCFFEEGKLRLLMDYDFDKPQCIRLVSSDVIEKEFFNETDARADAETAESFARYEALENELFRNELDFRRQVKTAYKDLQQAVRLEHAGEARQRILQDIARQEAADEAARRLFMQQINDVMKPRVFTIPVK